ncbi:MAG: RtcB family protein [Candidatus Moranbacteria bacterium]|nr:RtcB family protein [Candidatus Moranbacteria bacterium]
MKNYKNSIKKESEHKFKFKTDKMKVPATFFMSEELLPEEKTFRQVEDITSNTDLFGYAAMPDICSKPGRKNAAGSTIVSKDYIFPQVNDSDPNCGMRLVKTNLNEENFKEDEIEILFEELTSVVPTKKLIGTKIPFETVVDICRKGTSAAIDYLGIETKNELENTQNGGNFLEREYSKQEIFNAIPKLYLFFAQYRLGLLGAAGNHFLDMMKVTDIVDPEMAKKFGLKKGQYLFMVHTGSGILGQYTMYSYTAKKREHLSQAIMVALGRLTFQSDKKNVYNAIKKEIRKHMNDNSLLKYKGDSEEGKLYMTARGAASNFGTANRATIIHNINKTIKSMFSRNPEMDLLYDMPHISVTQENHFGEDVWVHRGNTSRAFGPSRTNHPIYGETGEPLFIPSSMSTDAYIGVGTDRNEDGFFSAPHGTGKGVNKNEKDVESKKELFEKMENKGVKLYNAKSSIVLNQDSARYKDISKVIEGVEANGITHIVAKMKPVAVIMY